MITNRAYIQTADLNAILFPDRKDAVTPTLRAFPEPRETYIQKLLSQKIMFFDDNFSSDDDVSNMYTPLDVRAIISNKNRLCMYLICSDIKTGVQIPGGGIHKGDFDVTYSEHPYYLNKESILLNSLTRNILTQFDSEYGESVYDSIKDDLASPRHKLEQILYSKFGICAEQPELWFSYILPNTSQSRFTFYYVYECDFKKGDGDTPLLPPKGVFMLNKELFRISSKHDRTTASNIIGFDPIVKGAVYEEYGRAQLTTIFNTHFIF